MDEQLTAAGFCIERSVLNRDECDELREALGPLAAAGRRGLLGVPAVAKWANSSSLVELVRGYLSGEPFPVRAIYFNKSTTANWSVGWHQDRTIAVRQRVEAPGFDGWSVKDGVTHVFPPASVLERMVTLRIHLDDADESNGALRVLSGSHRWGILAEDEIEAAISQCEPVCCEVSVGDLLSMKPLLLHSSGKCVTDRERRVLHIEYAVDPLPGGLEWVGGNWSEEQL